MAARNGGWWAGQALSERSEFGERLTLALKALNLSRTQLAADVAVDKSLVSRWLSGQVIPTGHNLARISEVLAKAKPGFNSTFWDRPRAEFEGFLNIVPAAAPAATSHAPSASSLAPATPVFPSSFVAAARNETRMRGAAYEGVWLCTRPSLGDMNRWGRDVIEVQNRDGLLHLRVSTTGADGEGWLFPVGGGFLQCMLHDLFFGRFAFLILNDTTEPQVDVMEGILLAIAFGASPAPTAVRVILHRLTHLSTDQAENDRSFDELRKRHAHTEPEDVPEHVRDYLLRDVGPTPFANGGPLLLQILRENPPKL